MMIYTYMFAMAFLAFLLTFRHLLATLVCMEFLALTLFFMITSISISSMDEMYCAFLFISIAVCEGALGLSITILYIRKKGNDLLF